MRIVLLIASGVFLALVFVFILAMRRVATSAGFPIGKPTEDAGRYFIEIEGQEKTEITKRSWNTYSFYLIATVFSAVASIGLIFAFATVAVFIPQISNLVFHIRQVFLHRLTISWRLTFPTIAIVSIAVTVGIAVMAGNIANKLLHRIDPKSNNVIKENGEFFVVATEDGKEVTPRIEVTRFVYLRHAVLFGLMVAFILIAVVLGILLMINVASHINIADLLGL